VTTCSAHLTLFNSCGPKISVEGQKLLNFSYCTHIMFLDIICVLIYHRHKPLDHILILQFPPSRIYVLPVRAIPLSTCSQSPSASSSRNLRLCCTPRHNSRKIYRITVFLYVLHVPEDNLHFHRRKKLQASQAKILPISIFTL
jgi:hypothetical protein